MHKSRVVVWATCLATLAGGVLNLWSVQGGPIPERARELAKIVPQDIIHLSRFLTLVTGLALVVLSINIYKRKKRAFQLTVALFGLSILLHLGKGIDYEETTISLALLGLLWYARHEFVVESSTPNVWAEVLRFGAALMATLVYGIAGFWFLDRREFGLNFHLDDAIRRTLSQLFFLGNDDLVPHTRHAAWFLDSLDVITVAALAYGLFALFRPVYYRYRTLSIERHRAEAVVRKHGRCALDYFKSSKDKTFFFSPTSRSFIAYKVGAGYAIALGDPVGPEDEMEEIIRRFSEFCDRNDWRVAFHQTLPDLVPLYKRLGFRRLKIGDDAVVDLTEFKLEGKKHKNLRTKVTQMENRAGVRFERFDPPLSDDVLDQIEVVSDGWLTIPGRRERTFAVGTFDRDYVRHTPIGAALDADSKIIAFVNEIPSYAKGEATFDMMRYLPDAPPGAMDYVFTKLMLAKKAEGYTRFNMAMAPMAGFQEKEDASIEERAVHTFMQRFNFLFSYQGLRHYKAKFATIWEPRYLIYRNILNLPRVAMALTEVSEVKDD